MPSEVVLDEFFQVLWADAHSMAESHSGKSAFFDQIINLCGRKLRHLRNVSNLEQAQGLDISDIGWNCVIIHVSLHNKIFTRTVIRDTITLLLD